MEQATIKSILQTICFFDLFDYPMTLIELKRWLYVSDGRKISLSALENVLTTDCEVIKNIESRSGFYFLRGRSALIDIRNKRYALGFKKMNLVLRAINWISFLPFIKMVAVCNHIGSGNIKELSDIDLLIVAKRGRIFLTRLMVTLVVSFLGLRRHGRKIANRLCLSFYLAEDALDLSAIKTSGQNVYLLYWLANLTPVYDRGTYRRLIEKNEHLLSDLTGWERKEVGGSLFFSVDRGFGCRVFFEFWLEGFLGDLLELMAKKSQLLKMSFSLKNLNQPGGGVVVSDQMLKFHENDRRLFYEKQLADKLASLL